MKTRLNFVTCLFPFFILLAACAQGPTVLEPIVITPADKAKVVSEISKITTGSSCANFSFAKGQGKPKPKFLTGMALSYARSICNPSKASVIDASKSLGHSKRDALAHYGQTADNALAKVYSLMVGSTAQESSWRVCIGKDAGANNTSSETAEAGPTQASWNSRNDVYPSVTKNQIRVDLFNEFKASKDGCFREEYGTCTPTSGYGSGDGLAFQKLQQSCPGFAIEYHALTLRNVRTHFGPTNTKAAQLTTQCTSMFLEVEKYVKANPNVCSAL